MGLKQTPLWGTHTRLEWVQMIDEILGPSFHTIHTQGPKHPDRESDPTKREKLIRDAYLQMLGGLTEVVWQMKENDADEQLIEQTDELIEHVLCNDVRDREVRIAVQDHVVVMHAP